MRKDIITLPSAASRSVFAHIDASGLRAPVHSRAANLSKAKRLVAVIAALAVTAALCAGAIALFRQLTPAPTALAAPSVAEANQAASTPRSSWSKGTLPHLYTTDAAWTDTRLGTSSVGVSGAAVTSLAMAYIQQTGDTTLSPAEFATFATENNLARTDAYTMSNYITQAAHAYGLVAEPLSSSERSIRQALAHGYPVIAITRAGAFGEMPSCIVLEGVNARSELDIVDPVNASNTDKSWTFESVALASTALYALHASSNAQ